MNPLRLALATALLLPPLVAQPPDPSHAAATRMHAAWLREVLDLDLPAAIAEYRAIAQDDRPSNPERWIAAARLMELQRLGIPTGYLPPLAEAPKAVREALAPVPAELPIADLLQRSRLEPAAKGPEAGAAEARPSLRPATGKVKAWLRDQIGPTIDASNLRRLQQRRQRQERRPAAPWLAGDILAVELAGRQEQAANLRALYFADWRPPTPSGEVPALLARIQRNLEAWSKEPSQAESETRLLQRLGQEIQRRTDSDPTSALELVLRLPLYAERLLSEPAPASTPAPDTAPTGR